MDKEDVIEAQKELNKKTNKLLLTTEDVNDYFVLETKVLGDEAKGDAIVFSLELAEEQKGLREQIKKWDNAVDKAIREEVEPKINLLKLHETYTDYLTGPYIWNEEASKQIKKIIDKISDNF